MPDNFDAVNEVLTEIKHTPNIKALLAVRTVDFGGDPRLRSLLGPSEHLGQHTVGDLDTEAVTAQIVGHGMQLPTSNATIELLRIPLHLSVFSRLSDSGRDFAYTTLQELYARYTNEVRARVAGRVGCLDWEQTTGSMVNYMSDHEVLSAPAGVMDSASPLQVEALTSESVIVRDGESVAFFHESYFDYLFARSFIAAGRDLRDFLLGSGQYLFRRAQTRQVLEHLAATDRHHFIAVVVGLLESDEIRFHLKSVVISVLCQIQPTPEEWAALEPFAWSDSPIASSW